MWFLLKFTDKQQAQYILQVMQDIKRYKSQKFCLLKIFVESLKYFYLSFK
jgi:hypothetical protein